MIEIRSVLVENFDYDLWANRQWLDFYQSQPGTERAIEVLDHIIWAQLVWIERVEPLFTPPEGNLATRMEAMNLAWKELLLKSDLEHVVQYRRLGGEAQQRTLWAIARHVADHGTYHRGQLREMASTYGFKDFPETGLNYFLQAHSLHEGS
ncbi:MAG: hypothetical protein KF824_05790 [Fimbriimonadaceae bacterium]|nr:MAG: hypothetical protein KF824_05790 [Fimbriimonadaceae bacterium]